MVIVGGFDGLGVGVTDGEAVALGLGVADAVGDALGEGLAVGVVEGLGDGVGVLGGSRSRMSAESRGMTR